MAKRPRETRKRLGTTNSDSLAPINPHTRDITKRSYHAITRIQRENSSNRDKLAVIRNRQRLEFFPPRQGEAPDIPVALDE